LLRSEKAAAQMSVVAEFAKAEVLVEETGSTTLRPSLNEWRAELAKDLGETERYRALLLEAREGYEAIGAHAQATRLATLHAD